MKRIILLAALLLLSLSAFAQSGKSIYQKYSDADGVSAVYISPAMFRLIGKIPDLKVEDGNLDLSPLIQSLSGLYLIASENPAINADLKADAERFVAGGRYELLMEAKEDGELIRIYTEGTESTVNGFVMIAMEADEVTFICIDGKMKREDLEKVLSEKIQS